MPNKFIQRLNKSIELSIHRRIIELKTDPKNDKIKGKSDEEIYRIAKEDIITKEIEKDMKNVLLNLITNIIQLEIDKKNGVNVIDKNKVDCITFFLKYMTLSEANQIYNELKGDKINFKLEKEPVETISSDTIYNPMDRRDYVKVIEINGKKLEKPLYFYKSTGTSRANPFDDPPKNIWFPSGDKLFDINLFTNKLRINKLEDEYMAEPDKIIREYESLSKFKRFINENNAFISKCLREIDANGKIAEYLGKPFQIRN